MRLLLSLTLTYLFFLFPDKSDANVFQKAPAITFTNSLSTTEDEDYSEYGNHSLIVFYCHNIRRSFNHRCAPDIQMDASGPVFTPAKMLFSADSIGRNCFYCIPIALKLLFPKHYFW